MHAIAPLEPHVANVLAQFPPWFARDDDALRGFLDTLPPHHRYVVEFREPSWYRRRRSTRCCASAASRCACTTCVAASRRASSPGRCCTFGCTGRCARTRLVQPREARAWAARSARSRRRPKRCSSTSTTTRRRTRRAMPPRCANCSACEPLVTATPRRAMPRTASSSQAAASRSICVRFVRVRAPRDLAPASWCPAAGVAHARRVGVRSAHPAAARRRLPGRATRERGAAVRAYRSAAPQNAPTARAATRGTRRNRRRR